MSVTLKLSGRLKEYAPCGVKTLPTTADLKLTDALKQLNFKEDSDNFLVIVDGENVPPSQREACVLQAGQLVNVMPPLKGG